MKQGTGNSGARLGRLHCVTRTTLSVLVPLVAAMLIQILLADTFAVGLAEAQVNGSQDADDLSVKAQDSKRQRYLSLFIGIEYQERLPLIPEGARFKGDFKKVTDVEVARGSGTLLFTPKKEGVATLTIHNSQDTKLYEFRIDVKKSNLTKVAREIRSLLSDVEGIAIKIINNRVVVDGQILLPRDMSRIHSVVKQYEGLASTIVTLSPMAQRKIASLIEKDIDVPEIHVRAVNDKFILEGVAADTEEMKRAFAIAQMYVPDIVMEEAVKDGVVQKIKREFVINLINIKAAPPPEPGKTIQLVVHFVELNKNYQKGFRFQWTPDLTDKSNVTFSSSSDTNNTGLISSITGTVSNLLPKLNWAKTHGHARILQSSSLLVMNNQKGDLRSVVRIPYTVINQEGQPGTQFEEAGLVSSITPSIINPRSDSIQLEMDFSIKNLLGITDQGPMVSNSALKTVIVVRSGQSAAVGGLIANTTGTDYNKLPKNVSDNPLISLYASKSFQRNQSQFVVFITPIIKSSASAGSEKIKKKFRLRD